MGMTKVTKELYSRPFPLEMLERIVLLSGDHRLAIALNLQHVKRQLLSRLKTVRMSSANATWMVEYKIQPCDIDEALRILTEEDRVDILVHVLAKLEPDKLQEVGLVCAWQGRARVLRFLCERGDVRARYNRVRLIDAAADRGHVDILCLLVEYGLVSHSTGDAHDTDEDDVDQYDDGLDSESAGDTHDTDEDDVDQYGDVRPVYKFLRIAAREGHISFVRRALELLPSIPATEIKDAALEAIQNGHLSVVETLFAPSGPPPLKLADYVVDGVAKYHDLTTLTWIYANSHGRCSRNAIDAVAEHRRDALPIIRFLHEQGHKCSVKAMDYAAGYGNLPLVRFLHENRQEGCTPQAISNALMCGAIDVAEFLHRARWPRKRKSLPGSEPMKAWDVGEPNCTTGPRTEESGPPERLHVEKVFT
ncbi:hypothetical protein HDU88_008007 [Geranomyces variabilis]|nr:hypothetical protein HDU88_008007 [Geranomyces variabilis]